MKIIITESHYRQILESLIDEAVPSTHLSEREFGRILNVNKLVIGYDAGRFNFIEVGTVKKELVINYDYSDAIKILKNYQLPYNTSYGIKLEDLNENLEKSINEIEIYDYYRGDFKEDFADMIRQRSKLLDRKLENKEIDSLIKRELANKKLLILGEGSNGNQLYLVIRNNVLTTMFFGIDNVVNKNPKERLRVDYYYDSIEGFISANENFKTGNSQNPNSVSELDILFPNKLMDKLAEVHTEIGQGSVFAKDLRTIKSITKKAIVDYLQNNNISGVAKFEINVDGIGYDLVKSKENLKNYNVLDIKTVYKKEKDERTGGQTSIPVKAAIVRNPLSNFKTDKMTIIFTKGRDEGKYFVITVYPGSGEGIPKASQWGDDFYVIIPKI